MIVRSRLPHWCRPALQAGANTLIVIGSLGVAAFVTSEVESHVYQQSRLLPWKESEPRTPSAVTYTPQAARPGMPWTLDDLGQSGALEIPRLQLRVAIQEGVDRVTLRHAVGHLPMSALPGAPGNTVLAGHRDTFFRPLRRIRLGDVIRFVSPKATAEYTVDSIRVVKPNAVEVLRATSEARATLITCYPFDFLGPAPSRFIVSGILRPYPSVN